jgi:uncharacterized membrane-anchored protein
MNPTETNPAAEESVFYTGYEIEVLKDNRAHSLKKLRNNLLVIAAMFLVSDVLALIRTDSFGSIALLYALVFPVFFTGLAFLSSKSPYAALTIAIILLVAVVALNAYQLGAASLFSGWIWKVVVVYLMIASFRHAKEAEEARKKLEEFAA